MKNILKLALCLFSVTLYGQQINTNQIQPGSSGQVLTTQGGIAVWGVGGGVSPLAFTGSIDGSNAVFVLPSSQSFVQIYVNGMLQSGSGTSPDYALSGNTVTFYSNSVPPINSNMQIFSAAASAGGGSGIVSNPSASQTITQPTGTSFTVNGASSFANASIPLLTNPTRTILSGQNAQCNNFGDSITAGYYAQPNNGTGNVYSLNGYATLLDNFEGWTCVNDGVSGSQAMDATQADTILGTTVTQGSISTMLPGANDMRSIYCTGCSVGMSTPLAQAQYAAQVEANAVWLAIPSTGQKTLGTACPTTGALSCTFAGTWTTAPSVGTMQTIVPGSTVTVRYSGSSGYFGTLAQFTNTSTYSLGTDGALLAVNGSTTIPTLGQISRTFNDAARNYSYNLIREALNEGPHTTVFTCIAASSGNPCYFAMAASNAGTSQRIGPNVYIGTTLRPQPAGYSADGGSDAIVSQFIGWDKEVAAELASDGLQVQIVNTSTVISPSNSSLYYTDGFHPSTAGHAVLAQAFEDAITNASLPNDRGLAQILAGVGLCTYNGQFTLFGCQAAALKGDIGSSASLFTNLRLGSDGGGIYRSSSNTMTILGGGAGLNQINLGGTAATYPAFILAANSFSFTDATGSDILTVHARNFAASGNIVAGAGTNNVYRCTTAGALPVGALTINAASCGASVALSFFVN